MMRSSLLRAVAQIRSTKERAAYLVSALRSSLCILCAPQEPVRSAALCCLSARRAEKAGPSQVRPSQVDLRLLLLLDLPAASRSFLGTGASSSSMPRHPRISQRQRRRGRSCKGARGPCTILLAHLLLFARLDLALPPRVSYGEQDSALTIHPQTNKEQEKESNKGESESCYTFSWLAVSAISPASAAPDASTGT